MVKVVGVVGAGTIGRGVAHNAAAAGYRVLLVDISQEILQSAMGQIRREFRSYRLLQPRGWQGKTDPLSGIETSTDYGILSEAEFVVENVVEDMDVKKSVYQDLDRICRSDVVFAANTSAIPVTTIGSWTKRPEQVLGIHFMNPVPLKPTVELIRGFHTSDDSLGRAQELIKSLGKDWVSVGDSPGFVSNRVLMLAVNEAAFLVHEGVASVEDIDRVFTSCFDHKMGMLATADLIGLDTVLLSINTLWEQFGDSKYRPCPLLKKMVSAGELGRKSGKGFYTYEASA